MHPNWSEQSALLTTSERKRQRREQERGSRCRSKGEHREEEAQEAQFVSADEKDSKEDTKEDSDSKPAAFSKKNRHELNSKKDKRLSTLEGPLAFTR